MGPNNLENEELKRQVYESLAHITTRKPFRMYLYNTFGLSSELVDPKKDTFTFRSVPSLVPDTAVELVDEMF
jgi:hypothetical protein